MEYADNDSFLINEQEIADGIDQDDDYYERKEQAEIESAEDKWEKMNS